MSSVGACEVVAVLVSLDWVANEVPGRCVGQSLTAH